MSHQGNTEQQWCAWQDWKEKLLLSKENFAASLQFSKAHIDKPEGYWNSVLWTDETKIDLFGLNVWRKENTAFQHKKPYPICEA